MIKYIKKNSVIKENRTSQSRNVLDIKRSQKIFYNWKNTVSEMKILANGLHSWLDSTEEKTSKLEDRIEIILN